MLLLLLLLLFVALFLLAMYLSSSDTLPNRAVHVPATVLLVRYWQKDMKSVFLGTLLGYLALFSVCM